MSQAIDSRERAEAAAKEAADQKAARVDADHAVAGLIEALATTDAKLDAAEAAHIPIRALTLSRKAVSDAERRVQEARTAFEKADYSGAAAAARSALKQLGAQMQELDKLTAAATRHHG